MLILDDLDSMSEPDDFLGQHIERLIDDLVCMEDFLRHVQHLRQRLTTPASYLIDHQRYNALA